VWDGEDAVDAAARAGADCLEQAGLPLSAVAALLVASEAPPQPVGLAAALHHRLGVAPSCPALEVGGACAGFLAALTLGRHLTSPDAGVLVFAVEAPSRWLVPRPGPAGEAAALFGDGAAACLLTAKPAGGARPLLDVVLQTDGGAGNLLRVAHDPGRGWELAMNGPALAQRAVRGMAEAVRQVAARHGLAVGELEAVVAHGGNGRMPGLLARQLGLPAQHVWSEAARAGNLGAASLPAAWAARRDSLRQGSGMVAWTTAAAGLQWGAALWGTPAEG
jgi:3-oxoacyl-[acyl-carrier-protein] synthase-3